jgi:hypothetical protein
LIFVEILFGSLFSGTEAVLCKYFIQVLKSSHKSLLEEFYRKDNKARKKSLKSLPNISIFYDNKKKKI